MGSLGGSSKSKSESKPLTPAQVQGYYNQLNTNSGGRLADFARNGTQPTQYTPVGAPERVTGASIDYEPLDFREQLNAPRVAPAAQANYSPVNRQVTAPKALGYGVNYTPYDYSALLQQPTVGAAAQASVSPIDAPAAVAAPTAATREVGYTELTPEQATAVGGLGALREQQARRANSQTLAQYAADPGLSTFQRLRANQLEQQDFGATLDALAQEREAAIVQLLADQRARTLQADLANQAEVNRGAQFNATQQASADQSNAQAVGLTNANNSTAMTQLAAQLGMDYQSLIGGLTSTEQGRRLQADIATQDARNQASQFNAAQQAAASQFNVATALADAQREFEASRANQDAINNAAQLQARLGMDYEQLLGGLTSTEQGRLLQAGQFNAGQQSTADQFNASLAQSSALTEAQRQYLAYAANAGLSAADMQALADIFFGGSGSTSTSTSRGSTGLLDGLTVAV
jgi:hypothetical protein